MGRAYCSLGDVERSEEYSKRAIEQFNKALKWSGWSKVGRADVEEDIAEAFFDMGDQNSARAQLEKVRNSLLTEINQSKQLGTEAPNWYYLTFGKVERLSSQISMVEGRLDEGLYGFATAYACFHLFSPSTIDKTQMLDNVFRQYLSDTSFGKLEELVGNLEKRISKQDCKINNVDVIPFIKDLKELIGLR
jgi:hypothetical protein